MSAPAHGELAQAAGQTKSRGCEAVMSPCSQGVLQPQAPALQGGCTAGLCALPALCYPARGWGTCSEGCRKLRATPCPSASLSKPGGSKMARHHWMEQKRWAKTAEEASRDAGLAGCLPWPRPQLGFQGSC